MGLQVCEYPKCKAITLMSLCEEHRHEAFDDDEPIEPQLAKVDAINQRVSAILDEAEKKKETTMPDRICKDIVRTGTRCASGCAKGSEYCQRHLDKREQEGMTKPLPQEKPEKHQLPAKRSTSSIVLAEPTQINAPPVRGVDLNGNAAAVLDAFIGRLRGDLDVLQAAKDVMERHGCHDVSHL